MRRTLYASCAGLTLLVAAGCDSPNTLPTAADLAPLSAKPTSPPSDISIVVLPQIGGGPSEAYAINDAEEIAGTSGSFAARWIRSSPTWSVQQLGTATGSATDINEAGTAVGSSGGTIFLWRRDGTSEAVGLGSAKALDEAETIVVGRSASGFLTAWVRVGGVWTPHVLPRSPGVTGGTHEPGGINDDGIIVGYSADAGNVQHAVKWVPSTVNPGEWDPPVPIDAFAGSSNSFATAIEGDDIAGGAFRCNPPTASCPARDPRHWSLSGASTIGSLGTGDAWAEGLNASRFIVGVFFVQDRGKSVNTAFVWSPAAPTIRDLGKPKGQSEAWAYDINNSTASRTAKQIVGYVGNNAGHSAAVWTLQ